MYRPVRDFSNDELQSLYNEIENELRLGKNFVDIANQLGQKYGIGFAEAEYLIQQVKLKSFGNAVIKPPKPRGFRFLKAFGGLGLIALGVGLLFLFVVDWSIGIPRFAIVVLIAGIAVILEQIFER